MARIRFGRNAVCMGPGAPAQKAGGMGKTMHKEGHPQDQQLLEMPHKLTEPCSFCYRSKQVAASTGQLTPKQSLPSDGQSAMSFTEIICLQGA